MKLSSRRLVSIFVFAIAFGAVLGMSVLMTGEPASKKLAGKPAAKKHQAGVVDDWSTRHLVYSNPGTYDQVRNDPAAYARWLAIQYDTRYIMQQMRRGNWSGNAPQLSSAKLPAVGLIGEPEAVEDEILAADRTPVPLPTPIKRNKGTVKKDWSTSLSGGISAGRSPSPPPLSAVQHHLRHNPHRG